MILLSILVPTLDERISKFRYLSKVISHQINQAGLQTKVEFLYYKDNREHTTGHKRNVLLDQAKGKFVVFVDDDDELAPTYVQDIVQVIERMPDIDAIGLQGVYTQNGAGHKAWETSINHTWEEAGGRYLRYINHISPIRREHAVKARFTDKVIGEDYDYTMQLKQLNIIKKEFIIQKPLYFYHYISNK